MEVIWIKVSPLSGYLTVKGKDPVKPHVKLEEGILGQYFLISDAAWDKSHTV